MRCLYCNKKLSLLKLAKGDSYCSAEHFDAHQLQMSKSAFERLMSLPSENSLKSPLVVKPREEPAAIQPAVLKQQEEPVAAEAPAPDASQQSAALARLTGFTAPPPEKPPLKAAPAFQVPPQAPFAPAQQLGSPVPPPSNIFWGLDASRPVDPAREVAFPVHDVESTICILNLYIRLSLAEAEPIRWLSARTLIVTTAEFPLVIRRPSAGALKVELPEILAKPPEVETIEAAQVEFAAEALVVEEAVVEALPDPIAEPGPVEPLEAASLELAVEAVPIAEIVSAPEPRLPFLIAPSFQLRSGTNAFMDHEGVSLPHSLSPALHRELSRLDQGPVLAPCSRPAAEKELPALDTAAHWIDVVPQVLAAALVQYPAAGATVRKDPWNPVTQPAVAAHDGVNANWPEVRALDFDPPAPAFVRPQARQLRTADPQQMLSGTVPLNTNSLFLGTLATNPMGTRAVFAARPLDAMEFGLRARHTAIHGLNPLPAAWERRSSHFALPFPMKTGTRTELDPDSPPANAVLPIPPAPQNLGYRSQTPWQSAMGSEPQSLSGWVARNPGIKPVQPDFGVVPAASTMLPAVLGLPARSMNRGSDSPISVWEPQMPADPGVQTPKFLPIRDRMALPAARPWPRLGAVPR